MTTRADVTALTAATRRLVAFAERDLRALVASADSASPVDVRDVLLQAVPEIVDRYGDAAAAVAAEWYEDLRSRSVPGGYNAVLTPLPPLEQVQKSVRWAVGPLFQGDTSSTIEHLAGSVQRYVTNQSRNTIALNVSSDRSRPRWARIPQGRVTCAWCTLLASRGFVYASRATAGEFDRYHDRCDCQPTPEWESEAIEGYDPGFYEGMYRDARASVLAADTPPNVANITAAMRRLFPDALTDGVHTH